jgi:uncharacterized protein YgiB involved in biofilm formation
MKRSRNVALVIVGAAALGGCGERSDSGETVFQSLADCRRFYDEDICRTKTIEAEKLHTETAPKFANREACEAAYGQEACVETNVAPSGQQTTSSSSPSQTTTQTHASGGGSWFMPAMMGYMLGRSMSTPTPLYYGPPSAVGTPEERQQRSLYSGGGYVGSTSASSPGRFNASAPASATATRVATAPSSTSRGGFGSTGRSYSGGSGS